MISKSTFPQSESFILLLRNFATKKTPKIILVLNFTLLSTGTPVKSLLLIKWKLMEASKTQNAQQKWNSHVPRSSDFFVDCASWCYFTCILGLFRFSFPVWSLSIEFLIRIETQGKSKTNIATILFEVQIVKPQNVMSKENIYFGYFIKPGKQLGTAFPAYISNILVQWECPCFGYPFQCTSAVGSPLFWGILSNALVQSDCPCFEVLFPVH